MLLQNSRFQRKRVSSLRTECLKTTTYVQDDIDYDQELFITFREDYDISALHPRVIAKLMRDRNCSDVLKRRITNLNQQCENAKSKFEQVQIIGNIKVLEKKLEVISNTDRLATFKNEAEPLLKKYTLTRGPGRSCVGYMNKNHGKTLYEPTKEDLERIDCITRYLDIAKRYYKLEYYCTGYLKELPWYVCDNCEEDLTTCPLNKIGVVICPRCSESKLMRRTNFPVDKSNPDATGPVKDNSVSILKALYEFQGKITPKADYDALAHDLDQYFQSIGKPSTAEIKALAILPNGKKPGTSTDLMRKGIIALVKYHGKNYQKFYTYTRFMCQYMWGWILEDFSSIEAEIVQEDRLLEEGYRTIPNGVKCRTSSIPTQIRLYFHLKKKGASCEREDFKLPKEINRYNKLLQLSCENAKIQYVSI